MSESEVQLSVEYTYTLCKDPLKGTFLGYVNWPPQQKGESPNLGTDF